VLARRVATVFALVAATRSSATSQGAPERVLARPLAELPEPFTSVSAIRELRDGRVIVVDSREKSLQLADFNTGSSVKLSREGAGPLEYRLPGILLAVGDSTYVLDAMLRRFLVIDGAGVPRRTQAFGAADGDINALMRIASVRAVDGRGRFYSDARRMAMASGEMPRMGDSVYVVRWQGGTAREDTMVRLSSPVPAPKLAGSAASSVRITVPLSPPTARDAWELMADGTLAVVRAKDYHVDFLRADGTAVSGPPIPHVNVPLTAADRERIRKSSRDAFERSLKSGLAAAGASATGAVPKIAFDMEEPKEWPAFFPPFAGVRAAPDGTLWIAQVPRSEDSPVVYDVIDGRGRLVTRVRFPARTSLVGFGKGVLYAVRVDDDDLHYLQRYPLR
jgi:hypothetical protein